MTVTANTTNRWSYTGDASTTAFAYTKQIFEDADLKVYQNGTLKTLTTHYTVSGEGESSGGNVTFVTAPALNDAIVIVRDVIVKQGVDYESLGPFPAESCEAGLDRLTIIAQQITGKIGRTLRQPDSDATDLDTLPVAASRASKYLAFDATGQPTLATLSAATLIEGSGIDIASNTVSMDISGLTTETTIDTAADYLPVYDASAAALRKYAPENLGLVLKAAAVLSGTIAATGDITPSQITGNTDDYAPTGLSTASRIRLSTDASRNLTGITGGSDGRRLTLVNVGSFDIVLTHDATSTAANRFYCPNSASFTIRTNEGCELEYDATVSRWRVVDRAAATSVSALSVQVITADGTYTKPSGLLYALVIAVGGGAGGGAGASTFGGGGGGGGSGGVGIRLLAAASIGATETVDIGAGGAAASAGSNTTFGALLTGGGGAAGSNAAAAQGSAGGLGGVGSTGDINFRGGGGGAGSNGDAAARGAPGGTGGSNLFGGGGPGGAGATSGSGGAGTAGQNYGGGGGGGGGGDSGAGAGGAGAAGVVFVLEFKSS